MHFLLNEYMGPTDEEDKRFILKLEHEAHKEWRAFQDHIETQLRPGGRLYPILGWGGKICGYNLRIAGLLHVMEFGHDILSISKETMGKALELAALLIDHALTAFNLMGTDDSQVKTKRVYEWIIANGAKRYNKRECFRVFRGQMSSVADLEEILIDLEDRNIISRPIHVGTGGRPSIFFDVNPVLFEEGE